MEKFIGKFKVIHDLTEGFDAYFDAMKIPDEVRGAMRDNKDLVTAIIDMGDGSYKEWNDYGDRQEEFVFKLNERCVASTHGIETTHQYTLKGDSLEGEHDVAGQKTTTSRYFQGDKMVFAASGNGATMKTFFSRIPE